jgi:hypothetical protein
MEAGRRDPFSANSRKSSKKHQLPVKKEGRGLGYFGDGDDRIKKAVD